MDHNDVLKDLHAQIQESSLVRSADDIQIGDIVYVEMDRNDGLVLVDGYDTRLKYIVVAGSKSDKKEFAVVLINSEADFSDDSDWQGEQYLLRHSDYADVLEHEKKILTEQVMNEGKPANIAEKIVEGRIGKYFKEVCLTEQAFVKDGNLSVNQYVANTAKELGADIKIASFVRFEKGEGIEKRVDDFANEVAGMIK